MVSQLAHHYYMSAHYMLGMHACSWKDSTKKFKLGLPAL